jgi:ABC-type branched-subunit amino acid transport system substrate-binding protein
LAQKIINFPGQVGLARKLKLAKEVGLALSLTFYLTFGLSLGAPPEALAQGAATTQPWRLTSWASPVGAQALSYESLCGLRALLVFLNANNALRGREIQLFSLDQDDSQPGFLNRLSQLIDQKKPHLAVGGAANAFPGLTANLFRRRGLLWHGPWSNSPLLASEGQPNPILLYPSEGQELSALMGHTRQTLGPVEAFFIHQKGVRSDSTVALAQATAQSAGLTLRLLAVTDEFRDWPALLPTLKEARAIFLWVPPGQAAALVRALKPSLGPGPLWLTNSLNSAGQELAMMTAGQWEGVIFPAVLIPKEAISTSYDLVIRKYGLPGLGLDYQTYLGFAQGQLLARVLSETSEPENLADSFRRVSAEGTLLYQPPGEPISFYLAVSDRHGNWRPVN